MLQLNWAFVTCPSITHPLINLPGKRATHAPLATSVLNAARAFSISVISTSAKGISRTGLSLLCVIVALTRRAPSCSDLAMANLIPGSGNF